MKKCLCILLAILTLATSSPNQQGLKTIVKINAFFHHFVHHIACNQERLGVIGFVQLHYSDHHHHEADHAEHEDLPFQHHSHSSETDLSLATVSMDLPSQFYVRLKRPVFPALSRSFAYQAFLSTHFMQDIWQPPKQLV